MKIPWFRYALSRLGHAESHRMVSSAESVKRAVLYRACVALRTGRNKLARSLIEEFDAPDRDAACLNVLGLLALNEGQLDFARKFWNQSLRRNPSYVPAMVNLRRLLYPAFFNERLLFGDESVAVPENREVHS